MIRNALLSIIGTALFIACGILFVGALSPREYTGEKTVTIYASRSAVWEAVANIDVLPDRHEDLFSAEILGENANGHTVWAISTRNNGNGLLLVRDLTLEKTMTLELNESSFGLLGTWTYTLEDAEEGTSLTLREDSTMDSWFVRGLLAFAGRNVFLEAEIPGIAEHAARIDEDELNN